MITEHDLKTAIAECQGVRNPSANTCIKLAAFYTIYDHLYGDKDPDIQPETEKYSYETTVPEILYSNSEFSGAVEIKGIDRVFPILDELMLTLQVINPKLYDSVMIRISEI